MRPSGGVAHSESEMSQATGHVRLTVTVLGLSPGRDTISSGPDTTIAVTQSSDGLCDSHVDGTRPLLSESPTAPKYRVKEGHAFACLQAAPGSWLAHHTGLTSSFAYPRTSISCEQMLL